MFTNIEMPRQWQKNKGCIAIDVGPISHEYFQSEMTDFRDFMGESEIKDIDLAWRSLCFQYESLEEDPKSSYVHERFLSLASEWSLRKRLYSTDDQSEATAKTVVKMHLDQMKPKICHLCDHLGGNGCIGYCH